MAFFNEFPHTRTYDSDLAWLIRRMKEILARMDSLEERMAALEELVADFIASLNIEQAIKDALQAMVDAGVFNDLITNLFNDYTQNIDERVAQAIATLTQRIDELIAQVQQELASALTYRNYAKLTAQTLNSSQNVSLNLSFTNANDNTTTRRFDDTKMTRNGNRIVLSGRMTSSFSEGAWKMDATNSQAIWDVATQLLAQNLGIDTMGYDEQLPPLNNFSSDYRVRLYAMNTGCFLKKTTGLNGTSSIGFIYKQASPTYEIDRLYIEFLVTHNAPIV